MFCKMNYKHVSAKQVISKIFRDLRINDESWVLDAMEWIGEALEHIGAASQLCQKNCVLNITDHKTLMPADLYYIV